MTVHFDHFHRGRVSKQTSFDQVAETPRVFGDAVLDDSVDVERADGVFGELSAMNVEQFRKRFRSDFRDRLPWGGAVGRLSRTRHEAAVSHQSAEQSPSRFVRPHGIVDRGEAVKRPLNPTVRCRHQ